MKNTYSKRVGILGGTFDPVHCGHIDAAGQVKHKMFLDEVWLIPNNIPPHRSMPHASADDRFRMCEIAAGGIDYLQVSDVEYRSATTSYAVNTIRSLKEQYPEYHFFFIIGVDAACEIMTWKDPLELVETCDFIVVTRPGYDMGTLWSYIHSTPLYQHIKKLHVIKIPTTDISSTQIREMITRGENYGKYVTQAVYNYIETKSLYR